MKLKSRIQKESVTLPIMLKGYSRTMANAWYRKTLADQEKYKNNYDQKTISYWHKRGYLCKSIEKYDLADNPETEYISDFEYLYLNPFNNSLSKWLDDIITTERILPEYQKYFRTVYFSIISRDGNKLILRVGQEDRKYQLEDVIALLREKGELELRPAFWDSERRRYQLSYQDEHIWVNGAEKSESALGSLIKKLPANYIISDVVPISYRFREDLELDHALKFWIANDIDDQPHILCAAMNLYWYDEWKTRRSQSVPVDLASGAFVFGDRELSVPNWEEIRREIIAISARIPQISYFSASVAIRENNLFEFLTFAKNPYLPEFAFNRELNDYLKNKFKERFHKRTVADRIKGFRAWRYEKHVKKHCRKGIRTYMQRNWTEAIKEDWLHTKGVSLKKKLWAWKRGYLSFRTYQYGLTEENYKNYLSDYDYYWLNRINNDYQKWVNDKTTFRYIMDPFKAYVPAYYFSCYRQNGETVLRKMWDCPADAPEGFDGLLYVLREKGKLAFKASAGTHGDGFYCLGYENREYTINGEATDENGLRKLIASLQSFYVATEYLEMHDELKKIYAKSVNTVRIMVINAHGYDPKIMQTYMRIGSEKTGFTDNVGYGGVCAMVDIESGELYHPEQLKEHVYYPCPKHPDTGTEISGALPNWPLVRERVLDISRYLCELEYLGFDIAITNDGFRVLEVNIHQDLHKVSSFNEEIMDFYRKKIKQKRRAYGVSSDKVSLF